LEKKIFCFETGTYCMRWCCITESPCQIQHRSVPLLMVQGCYTDESWTGTPLHTSQNNSHSCSMNPSCHSQPRLQRLIYNSFQSDIVLKWSIVCLWVFFHSSCNC
jgi:hypothetical protein